MLVILVVPVAQASPRAEASTAQDEPELRRLAEQLANAVATPPPEGVTPVAIEAHVESLAALVDRARTLDASAALLGELIAVADALEHAVTAVRERLEDPVLDDEAALETLYRSTDWQRLGYARSILSYADGWAHLALAFVLPAGEARSLATTRAERAFSRSARSIRLPRIATSSLLGLGLARRDRGDAAGAKIALERVLEQLAAGGTDAPGTRAMALYGLASLALAQGSLEPARALIEAIPKGELGREQQLSLVLEEAAARLAALERGDGGGDASASAERAAALLRELAAAGGGYSERAARLASQYSTHLRGRDIGAVGVLLDADAAFEAGAYAEAAANYARVLTAPDEIPGGRTSAIRFKYAVALAESQRAQLAAAQLEQLVAEDGLTRETRAAATRLLHRLAVQLHAASPDAASQARALSAARLLLEADPDAADAGADLARQRVARASEHRSGGAASIAMLEAIPEESAGYPTARLDLARLRAAQLQRLEARGRSRTSTARTTAAALAHDIDTIARLVDAARLSPEPRRDATLAVLRVKAAALAGEADAALEQRLDAAEALPDLAADEQRVLRQYRLRLTARRGDHAALARALDATDNAALRREWAIWSEVLRAVEATAPLSFVEHTYERLEATSPVHAGGGSKDSAQDSTQDSAQDTLALDRAALLLRRGEAARAAERTALLVERDPSWADAWILHARALEGSNRVREALDAWRKVAAGLEPDETAWLRANVAVVRTALATGALDTACATALTLAQAEANLGADSRRTLNTARSRCEPGEPEALAP